MTIPKTLKMDIDFQEQVANKTNEELLHIYANSDEYQEKFVETVSDELIKRNVNFEKVKLQKEQKERFARDLLEKGREGNHFYMVLCYISALFGGLIGIIGGYIYSQSKHKNNLGESYYVYNDYTRKQGRLMMIIGFFVTVLVLLWKLS